AFGERVARLRVEPFHVTLFADRDRRVAEDLDEVPLRHLSSFVAYRAIRTDDRAQCGTSVLGHHAGHVTDAANVCVAVFLAESEAFGQMSPDLVAIERRDVPAELCQPLHQRVGDGALSRPREAGEPDRQALAKPWRAGFVEDLRNRRPAE